MHCNNLRLVLGLGLVYRVSGWVRVRIRVKDRVSAVVRVSIRTRWVVNFALFRCYRPVIYTRPVGSFSVFRCVTETSYRLLIRQFTCLGLPACE